MSVLKGKEGERLVITSIHLLKNNLIQNMSELNGKRKQSPHGLSNPRAVEEDVQDAHRKNHGKSMNERYLLEGSTGSTDFVPCRKERSMKNPREGRSYASAESVHHDSIYKCQSVASKLTKEE
ncbi:hypothetical protein OIU79_029089 [Salix purpurea]|uniref:Uncharacterized protein n=1 Tax=Salix purpurea TaxID=77065 RepID=A0A9Q0VY03_SALPP|nr:hypothetical protein OIU79_029089 [Salix purpurea]